MADDKPDPRETPWHPRLAKHLYGHLEARHALQGAFSSSKAHHAWLIAGPRGIGKATLAYALAHDLLGGVAPERFFTGQEVGHHANWIASRSHPELFILERAWDEKKIKSEIVIDDARRLQDFCTMTSASGGWRIVIIDAADDLNIAAANSLLKLIEEPPPKTLLLLVAHRLGRVMRTIRSRCVTLKLDALSEADTRAVLSGREHDSEALNLAVALSKGSPGRALELLQSPGAKAFSIFHDKRIEGPASIHAFTAQYFTRATSTDDFNMFGDLLLGWLGTQAKHLSSPPLANAYRDIAYSIRQANALNLDRRQTVAESLALVDAALKAS